MYFRFVSFEQTPRGQELTSPIDTNLIRYIEIRTSRFLVCFFSGCHCSGIGAGSHPGASERELSNRSSNRQNSSLAIMSAQSCAATGIRSLTCRVRVPGKLFTVAALLESQAHLINWIDPQFEFIEKVSMFTSTPSEAIPGELCEHTVSQKLNLRAVQK